tara:strand:- start:4 stop:1128 length:1125 start_codon:yes stop_codon:yes gene_type:complete
VAKKLLWGKFTTDDLVIDSDDDIYCSFPFLKLVGMKMVNKDEFLITFNEVRGIKDTVMPKMVALSGSLSLGWDRTSWPVPYMEIKDTKTTFDRRHTVKSCMNNSAAKEIPGAEYERAYAQGVEFVDIFNEFEDKSILTMAAMWGNVYGPIAEDTKDYMFQTACVHILRNEVERHEEDLLTRSFIKSLLRYMGCNDRYNNNNTVIERIVTKSLDSLKDPETVVGKKCHNNNKEDVDKFLNETQGWGLHNTEDDDNIYVIIPLQDNETFCFTYAERLLTNVCKNQKQKPEKITKALLWNKENSQNAQKIMTSRQKFEKRINSSYQLRRDNALQPVEQILKPDMVPHKSLCDLPLEIWCMDQIEGEEEPYEILFDLE